jgi:S-DNA-T family DNA segregation ATPase FtsK/SpoIIIE
MAQNTYKSNTFKKPEKEKKAKSAKSNFKFSFQFINDPRFKLAVGFFLMIVGVSLFLALFSYLFTWQADESVVQSALSSSDNGGTVESGLEAENWLKLVGAVTAHVFVKRWFGIAAFFIPPFLFIIGFKIVFNRELLRIFSYSIFAIFSTGWLCLLLGYMVRINSGESDWSYLAGGLGLQLATFSEGMFGWGTFLILILSLFVFIIFYFNVTAIPLFQTRDPKPMGMDAILPEDEDGNIIAPAYIDEKDNWPDQKKPEVVPEVVVVKPPVQPVKPINEIKLEVQKSPEPIKKETKEPVFIVEEPLETDQIAEQLVEEQGAYDPTLDLSNYKFPTLELLNEYDGGKSGVTQEELNENKDRIVATLVNFKIGIQSIKATIGPTVTLYEIVPDAGIKISRIKNLEDDRRRSHRSRKVRWAKCDPRVIII